MTSDPRGKGGGRGPREPRLLDEAVREVVTDLSDTAKLRRAQASAGLRRAWHERPPLVRALALLLLAATVLAGAATSLATLLAARRLPAPADWAAVRALLERDGRPGDAVAVAPAWAERARQVLPASVPVLAMPRLAGEDLPGVRRVWLVTLTGAPRAGPPPSADLAARAGAGGHTLRLGGLEVKRFDLPDPALPLAFLPDRIAGMGATLGGAACEADAGGFRCGSGETALRVERTLREVDGVARPCLSVSPGGPLPAPLVLTFPAVPVGRTLRGHVGVAGAGPAGPLAISVLLDGERAGSTEVTPRGFAPFRLDTARFAGSARDLGLVVTAVAPVGDLCLDAVTLP